LSNDHPPVIGDGSGAKTLVPKAPKILKMHIFGFWGTLSFLLGGGLSFYLIVEKVYKSAYAIPTRDVTDKPLFYLALVAMIIGTQLFLAGFLGELISRSSSDRNQYQIEKRF
jgi:hypothetical protein